MRRFLILCGLAVLAPATFLFAGSALGAGSAVATTGAATAVTSTGATVNGTVNPNGQATTYAFQWGLTASYGNEAPLPPASAGAGTRRRPRLGRSRRSRVGDRVSLPGDRLQRQRRDHRRG